MTHDHGWRRRCLALAALLLVLPLSGCSLLIDEFTWLDRAPPPADDAGDAAAGP